MELSLKGKKALVCGSSQGIGKAAAHELATMGADVVLLARNEASLKEALKDLPYDKGQQHGFLVADFSQPLQLKSIIKAILL